MWSAERSLTRLYEKEFDCSGIYYYFIIALIKELLSAYLARNINPETAVNQVEEPVLEIIPIIRQGHSVLGCCFSRSGSNQYPARFNGLPKAARPVVYGWLGYGRILLSAF